MEFLLSSFLVIPFSLHIFSLPVHFLRNERRDRQFNIDTAIHSVMLSEIPFCIFAKRPGSFNSSNSLEFNRTMA